ncbi:GTPase/DUF3482 domain-containing protein [Noviherbaspirillum sp. ST9]|uniref:GTPase/DUF3482 domain-containing protein n=1 Tax=Noviherbaspirillum sp. ST9 TaxID=3401606 RepID=UPI003B5878D6
MADAIQVAVVGHTNAGKTSLLRTLTRRVAFGEVSAQPGTTRHVEVVDLKVNGQSAVRFFDTPGLEDAVTLLDLMKGLDECPTPPDRIRAFLRGPEARGAFEQEAKVLRKMLEVDAGMYVIDSREAVLPKFRAEIEILTWCARPVMPVLNFVRDARSRKDEWLSTLAAYNMHACVQFDAVAPFVGSEQWLYQDMATLMRERRADLTRIVEYLGQQRRERQAAARRVVADLLISLAALRQPIAPEDFADAQKRERFLGDFRAMVLRAARVAVDDLLSIYGFRTDDADVAMLPWLDGRWEDDLFDPETLRDASRTLGTGAALGAAIGAAADIALAGLSLGTATAVGAAIGGLASQGWGQFGRRLANKVRGVQELTLENEVLYILAAHMVDLLAALELRGHAAEGKFKSGPAGGTAELKPLLTALQPGRAHPDWALLERRGTRQDQRRTRLVETVSDRLKPVVDARLQ